MFLVFNRYHYPFGVAEALIAEYRLVDQSLFDWSLFLSCRLFVVFLIAGVPSSLPQIPSFGFLDSPVLEAMRLYSRRRLQRLGPLSSGPPALSHF